MICYDTVKYMYYIYVFVFPIGTSDKQSACNVGDPDLIPG